MDTLITSLLLFFGLFFPSSSSGTVSTFLLLINMIVLLTLLTVMIVRKRSTTPIGIASFLGINALLIISTIFSPFSEIRSGSYILYFALSIIMLLNVKGIRVSSKVDSLFTLVNAVLISVGLLIISNNEVIKTFVIDNYSAAYKDLVKNMMVFNKPVLTFGTHSLAGFFVFLLFYVCFERYKVTKERLYLVYSLAYALMLFFIGSVTSFLFLGIVSIMLIAYFSSHKKKKFLFTSLIIIVLLVYFSNEITSFSDVLTDKFSSTGNGIIGRYSSTGNLQKNFTYLSENYFRPVGFGYSPDIMYVDSGYVEYLTRGTILLVALIFLGLYNFLKQNLINVNHRKLLFLSIIFFEIGFSVLTYYRTLYILPFFVIYLNHIHEMEPRNKPTKRKFKIRL